MQIAQARTARSHVGRFGPVSRLFNSATRVAPSRAGSLTVAVTNLWPNRLIVGEQLPPDTTFDGPRPARWPQRLFDGKPSPTGRLTFAACHMWEWGEAGRRCRPA